MKNLFTTKNLFKDTSAKTGSYIWVFDIQLLSSCLILFFVYCLLFDIAFIHMNEQYFLPNLKSLCEKSPNTEFFLVRIFPHSDWIRTRKKSVFGRSLHVAFSHYFLIKDVSHRQFYLYTKLLQSSTIFKQRNNDDKVFCD